MFMNTPSPHDLPPTRETPNSNSMLDFHGTIRLILDRGILILLCLGLATIAAAVFVYMSPSIYEATALLEVQQEGQKIFKENEVPSMNAKDVEILNTIVQKLQDPVLLEKVLATNNMLPPEGTTMTNSTGQLLTREKIISQFASTVKVTLRRNTFLIDVAVRNADPKLAARLASSIVETYLEQDALADQTMAELAVAPLQHEADHLMKTLEASEQALQDYRKQVGSVSLDQSQDIITPEMQNLDHLLTLNAASLVQARGAYEDSLKMGTNIDELMAYAQIASDPKVVQISTAIAQLEDDFVLIRQRYREKHPKYILAVDSLAGLKNQLAQTVLEVSIRIQESQRINYESYVTAQEGLQAELTNAENKVLELGDNSVHFNVLSRKVASDLALYDAVINQVGETAISAQVTPEKIRIIRFASPPEKPVSPRKLLIYAMGMFVGLGLGLGLCFVLHSLDTSFQTVDEIEQQLALPVLGTIPKLRTKGGGRKPVILEAHNFRGVEVFRTLRASIALLNRGKNGSEKRTFLFTSSLPNEGKSFVAINHAASLAQQGLRTLLIDMDLRDPMIEKFFSGKRGQLMGVSDYFVTKMDFDFLCVPCKDIPNLHWMPTGTPIPDPSELLAQIDFQKLLDEALLHFDRIIIDTAPLLPVSDTLLFVHKADAVGLIVQWSKTSRLAVQRSMRLLFQAGALVDGLVLNLLPNRILNNYYYSYNYGGGHKHYERKNSSGDTTILTKM
jgi:capsular exopolysaccharide synthesis family protein